MLKNGLRKIRSGCESFDTFRIRVVAWFVRLAWLPALVWGCIDLVILWTQPLSSTEARERVDDAAISLGLGSVLFLVWFFMYRRRGSWTLNKGGKLER
jgi:hypothetical protein